MKNLFRKYIYCDHPLKLLVGEMSNYEIWDNCLGCNYNNLTEKIKNQKFLLKVKIAMWIWRLRQ